MSKPKKINVYSKKLGREVQVALYPKPVHESQKSGMATRMLVPPPDGLGA